MEVRYRWIGFARAVAIVLLVTWLPACGGGDSKSVEVGFQTLEQELQSAYSVTSPDPGEVHLIRSQAEWAALWALLKSGTLPAPPLPAVDFTVDSVVAVLSTPRSTLGYQVTLDRVLQSETTLFLYISQISWGSALTLVGRPYHLVVVNTASAGFVVVNEWKDVAS